MGVFLPDVGDSANAHGDAKNAESHSPKKNKKKLDQIRKNFCMVE